MGIPRNTIIIRNINVTNIGKITGPRAASHTQVDMNMHMGKTHTRGEMTITTSLGTIVHRSTVGDGKNTVSTNPDLEKRVVAINIHARKRRPTIPNMEGTVDTLHRITSPVTAAHLTVMVRREVNMGDMKGVNREQLLLDTLIERFTANRLL